MCLLLITSSISMQLFCFIENLEQFETFPRVSRFVGVVGRKRTPFSGVHVDVSNCDEWRLDRSDVLSHERSLRIRHSLRLSDRSFLHLLSSSHEFCKWNAERWSSAWACLCCLIIRQFTLTRISSNFCPKRTLAVLAAEMINTFGLFFDLGIHVDVSSSHTKRMGWCDALHNATQYSRCSSVCCHLFHCLSSCH